MGMAASQARYIELTARKTNCEYEGQQINQERTALANQSSGLFTQMMSLKVPVPPTTSDYSKLTYTFSDGTTLYTITDIGKSTSGDAQYNAHIKYNYQETKYSGQYKERSDLPITNNGTAADPVYYYGTTKLKAYDSTADDTALAQIKADKPDSQVAKDYDPTGTNDKIYSYVAGTQTYYITLSQGVGVGVTNQPVQSCFASDKVTTIYRDDEAYLTKSDSSERYTSVQIDGYSDPYSLTAKTITDEGAYNDAMNEYEYQTMRYEKEINDINTKTKKIEEEDRTLEMKLKQLDTEQEALSTEMDAVKKVIDKNIEQTYKTFS